MKRKPVRELYVDAVDTSPRSFDYSEGYPERWDYFEACRCEECNKVKLVQGEEHHHNVEDTDCRGYLNTEGPMMDFFYPLPHFDHLGTDEAAKLIVDLPLCVIYVEDMNEYGLALTGGGMDLSWEICEAYMRLNYLPPVHFCDLPGMAGKRLNTRTKWILAGCRRSLKVVEQRASFTREHLQSISKSLQASSQR